ncbi:hypothetical protein RSAG8_04091, partial [Rhizoctonia solani AG-8 WAC10335]
MLFLKSRRGDLLIVGHSHQSLRFDFIVLNKRIIVLFT